MYCFLLPSPIMSRPITVLYFAKSRELTNKSQEHVDLSTITSYLQSLSTADDNASSTTTKPTLYDLAVYLLHLHPSLSVLIDLKCSNNTNSQSSSTSSTSSSQDHQKVDATSSSSSSSILSHNLEYVTIADASTRYLEAGDEVAIIPPIAGG